MTHWNYALLGFLWIAYCVLHSVLISIMVTNCFKRLLGEDYRYYRLFFNLISVVTLVPLVIYSYSARWRTELLFKWEGDVRIIQYGLITLAMVLLLTGARHYSLLQFLGIRQIIEGRSGGGMTESGEFDSRGILGVVRHPWYVAVFILLWTRDFDMARITVSLVLSAYLVVGTLLEERKLILEFGDKYRAYQRQVSMFIPLKWLRSRLQKKEP